MEKEKNNPISFVYSGLNNRKLKALGIPELEGKTGVDMDEKMAMFWGKGYEMYIVNTETGKIRKFSDIDGNVLVDPEYIDMESIKRNCEGGIRYALNRSQGYGCMNRYDDFKNGVAAISWMLYPDGRYFADDGGFGGESNNEETVYCIINRDLEIIRPFAFVSDIKKLLKDSAIN